MARPLSEEKRNAILEATINLIAKEGMSASTSRIAREAGVSEGSIFTYFSNKDDLFNQVYIDLKEKLRGSIMVQALSNTEPKDKFRSIWEAYVSWGVAFPRARNALTKLYLSGKITKKTQAEISGSFCEVTILLKQCALNGPLSDQPEDFIEELMAAMLNATIDHILKKPEAFSETCNAGFSAFWLALNG